MSLKALILVIIVIALFLSGCSGSEKATEDPVSKEELVMAAMDTVVQFNQTRTQTSAGPFIEISEELWAEEIKTLDPLRVYWHHNNLALVLRETGPMEEGVYIGVPISSYAPESDATIQLTPEEDGLYVFKKER